MRSGRGADAFRRLARPGSALADPGLARFIGDRLRFTLRGTASEGGGEFETLKLSFGGAELGYAGQLGPARILGKVQARLPDLSRLGTLAGRPLEGSANVTADVDAEPKKRLYAVKLDGGAESLTLGQEALDRLLAGKLSLGGEIRVPASSGLVVSDLRIAGAHVHLCFDGQEQPSTLHLADAGIICHDDGGPAEPHQDRDVDALGTALAKKDAHDHTLDAPVFANAVLALLAPPQGNDSSFVALDTPSVNRPYLHRPQLRGPPR